MSRGWDELTPFQIRLLLGNGGNPDEDVTRWRRENRKVTSLPSLQLCHIWNFFIPAGSRHLLPTLMSDNYRWRTSHSGASRWPGVLSLSALARPSLSFTHRRASLRESPVSAVSSAGCKQKREARFSGSTSPTHTGVKDTHRKRARRLSHVQGKRSDAVCSFIYAEGENVKPQTFTLEEELWGEFS